MYSRYVDWNYVGLNDFLDYNPGIAQVASRNMEPCIGKDPRLKETNPGNRAAENLRKSWHIVAGGG